MNNILTVEVIATQTEHAKKYTFENPNIVLSKVKGTIVVNKVAKFIIKDISSARVNGEYLIVNGRYIR